MTEQKRQSKFIPSSYGGPSKLPKLSAEDREITYRPYLRGLGRRCTYCGVLREAKLFRQNGNYQGLKTWRGMCRICEQHPEYQARTKAIRKKWCQKNREKVCKWHREYRVRHWGRRKLAQQRRYWSNPKRYEAYRRNQRHTPGNRIYFATIAFNQRYGTSFSIQEMRDRWLPSLKFKAVFRQWVNSGYQKKYSPCFDLKNEEKPPHANNITVLPFSKKRSRRSRDMYESGRNPLKSRNMQATQANKQLEG
jgi:hypothetical protein